MNQGSRSKSCHIPTFRKTYMEKNEKTVERACQMIMDLTSAGVSMNKITKGAKVDYITVLRIKDGTRKRISERVFDSIWDFWSENAPPRTNGQSADGQETTTGPVEATQAAEAGKPSPAPTKAVRSPRKAALKPKATKKPRVAKAAAKQSTIGQKAAATAPADLPPINIEGLLNRDYVPVDMKALTALIDGLITRFQGQIEELEAVRKLLK